MSRLELPMPRKQEGEGIEEDKCFTCGKNIEDEHRFIIRYDFGPKDDSKFYSCHNPECHKLHICGECNNKRFAGMLFDQIKKYVIRLNDNMIMSAGFSREWIRECEEEDKAGGDSNE